MARYSAINQLASSACCNFRLAIWSPLGFVHRAQAAKPAIRFRPPPAILVSSAILCEPPHTARRGGDRHRLAFRGAIDPLGWPQTALIVGDRHRVLGFVV